MPLRPVHAGHSAASSTPAEGPSASFARTCANGQEISTDRAQGRAEAKQIARDAATETIGILGVGRALDLSDSAGRKLCDPVDPLPLALGDVLAIGRSEHPGARDWAEHVLSECLALVRGPAPSSPASLDSLQRLLARDAGIYAGILDKALADGRIDSDEALALKRAAQANRRHWDSVITKLEEPIGR